MSSQILPASMPVTELLEPIVTRHQMRQKRTMQTRIGPSEIGIECDRALAYRMTVQGNPDRPRHLAWAALLGTWIHAGIAQALVEENERLGYERYLVEKRVVVDPVADIDGSTDCYDTETNSVVDWKAVGSARSVEYGRRFGPSEQYKVQAHLYGRGWQLAGYPVKAVRIVFLPRWSNDIYEGWEWGVPYDENVALEALERLAEIRDQVELHGLPEASEKYTLIKTNSSSCKFCPWKVPGMAAADATGCPGSDKE